MESNSTLDVIKNRVSLRTFSDKDISSEIKDVLFQSAMLAPTAGNQMLYSMIDITDQKLKDTLAISCDNQGFIGRAPMLVVFIAEHQKWFDYFSSKGVKEFTDRNDDLFFEGPQEGDLMLACQDAMIAAQNMVIAAESLGIGSCYIGDIIENYEDIKELLNLPDCGYPIGMLVLGYYKDDYKRVHRKRFDQKYVVFENSYRNLSDQDLDDMFKDKEKKFKLNENSNAENFAQAFYERKTGAAFSKEMNRSARIAMKKWNGEKIR